MNVWKQRIALLIVMGVMGSTFNVGAMFGSASLKRSGEMSDGKGEQAESDRSGSPESDGRRVRRRETGSSEEAAGVPALADTSLSEVLGSDVRLALAPDLAIDAVAAPSGVVTSSSRRASPVGSCSVVSDIMKRVAGCVATYQKERWLLARLSDGTVRQYGVLANSCRALVHIVGAELECLEREKCLPSGLGKRLKNALVGRSGDGLCLFDCRHFDTAVRDMAAFIAQCEREQGWAFYDRVDGHNAARKILFPYGDVGMDVTRYQFLDKIFRVHACFELLIMAVALQYYVVCGHSVEVGADGSQAYVEKALDTAALELRLSSFFSEYLSMCERHSLGRFSLQLLIPYGELEGWYKPRLKDLLSSHADTFYSEFEHQKELLKSSSVGKDGFDSSKLDAAKAPCELFGV